MGGSVNTILLDTTEIDASRDFTGVLTFRECVKDLIHLANVLLVQAT